MAGSVFLVGLFLLFVMSGTKKGGGQDIKDVDFGRHKGKENKKQ